MSEEQSDTKTAKTDMSDLHILLVDDDVVQRAGPVLAHPVLHGLGQRPPLGDQLGRGAAGPAVHLSLRPRAVVVVGFVAREHVGVQADHVGQQLGDGPGRAGGHAQLALFVAQGLDEFEHPALSIGPFRDRVHAETLTLLTN